MAENQKPDTSQNSPQPQDVELKKPAYYSAIYDAYFATLIEADKSILTISAGGVGLLVTLLNVFQVKSAWDIIIYLIALAFFVTSIVASIFIFKRNRAVLMNLLMDKEQKDSVLTFLDYLNIISCILGIILTIYIGLSAGIQKLNAKPIPDTNNASQRVQINTLNGNVILQGYSNYTSNQGAKKNGK